MIKDPYFKDETPYDILGTAVNATHKEIIDGALQKFLQIKKNIGKVQKGMAAEKILRKVRSRIGIDIMYYCIGKYKEEVVVYNLCTAYK